MSGSPLPKRNNRNLALLLSGLVFPGSGHFVLGHKIRGAIFVLPTLAANVFMLRDVMARADQLVDQINSGALPLDPQLILEKLQALSATNGAAMSIAVWVLIACWIGSLVDTFIITR